MRKTRGVSRYRHPVSLLALAGLSLGACQCGPIPCKGQPVGTGLEEEVCIPGDSFSMGHETLPRPEPRPDDGYVVMPMNDWAPVHTVTLSPYFIDKYKVTIGRYRKCVDAGFCSSPSLAPGLDFRDPALDEQPVDGVEHSEAADFCLWQGKRLPTEAEWEHAARGPKNLDYPWGNSLPSEAALNEPLSSPVGSNPENVSPHGAHDLWSPFWEWVADWYDPHYYEKSAKQNPNGPAEPVFFEERNPYGGDVRIRASGERVVRGRRHYSLATGDEEFWDVKRGAPLWVRAQEDPRTHGNISFRCVREDGPLTVPPPSGAWTYRNLSWRAIPSGGGR